MTDVLDTSESRPRTDACGNPVFILTASRSGSTLLRFILDTHPDFACPPETMITEACVALLRSWDVLENAGSGQHRLVSEPAQLPDQALRTVRDSVDQIYSRYLARRGKPRWCDKSLDSLYNAELLAQLYPQARFVCLYRHCMDVIVSGAEVCPWGVSRFGFDGYVAQHPGNTVAAIGSYWADCVGAMLSFEERQPSRCYRVRYEDLVTAPEEMTADLLAFLGAAPMPSITTACFDTPHEGDGPGDEKIWFTTKVTAETIGRGVKVPADALPPPIREQINELLSKLSYRPISGDWNDAAAPLDPRLPDDAPAAGGAGAANGRAAAGRARSTARTPAPVLGALRERIRCQEQASDPRLPTILWPTLAGHTVTLVVTDDDGQLGELSWTFPRPEDAGVPEGSADGSSADGWPTPADDADQGPIATMIAGSQVWQALLDGRANMITEIRNGRLRCVNKRDAYRVRSDEVHAIGWLLGLAQVPLVRQAG
jgi:protein-tyrosine sulfotransferase